MGASFDGTVRVGRTRRGLGGPIQTPLSGTAGTKQTPTQLFFTRHNENSNRAGRTQVDVRPRAFYVEEMVL